jgi:hypothetical protein
VATACALLSLLFGFWSVGDSDFAFPALVLLVLGFVLARVRLSWHDTTQLSVLERRLIYVPIKIVLLLIALVIFSPPMILTAYWLDYGFSDAQRFLSRNRATESSYLATGAFILASGIGLGAIWFGFVLILRKWLHRIVAFVTFPFLVHPPGRWTIVGSIASLLIGVMFAIVAWSIAMD